MIQGMIILKGMNVSKTLDHLYPTYTQNIPCLKKLQSKEEYVNLTNQIENKVTFIFDVLDGNREIIIKELYHCIHSFGIHGIGILDLCIGKEISGFVQVDYKRVMDSPLVKDNLELITSQLGIKSGFLKGAATSALKTMVNTMPNKVENIGVNYINGSDLRKDCIQVMEDYLKEMGIYITIKDFKCAQMNVFQSRPAQFHLEKQVKEILK